MSLGMAEEKLETDPEGAPALLAEARSAARRRSRSSATSRAGSTRRSSPTAGSRPRSRAGRASPVPVALSVDVPERPAAGGRDGAAYFVVAEALANAIKHADATRIDVRDRARDGVLVAEVEDDGRGGADPAGNGLTGLDSGCARSTGRCDVASPAGGPTTVRAELPCA